MDKEPQPPARPSDSSIQDSKIAFVARNWTRLTSAEAELWDYVPPAPNNNDLTDQLSSMSMTNNNNNVQTHKNNILYQFNNANNDNNHIKKSNHLFKSSRPLSASTDQLSPSSNRAKHHLIDWNASFSVDQNGNTDANNSKEKILELFKSVATNGGRSNSLSSNISNGFNFQPNPLYHNSSQSLLNNNYINNNQQSGLANVNDNNNKYANLYWPACPMVTSTSLPVASPLSPIANQYFPFHQSPQHHFMQHNQFDPVMNQKLIEKIKTVASKNQDNNNQIVKQNPDVLTPLTIYKNSPEDPRQIIDLFDPLAVVKKESSSDMKATPTYVNVDAPDSQTMKDDIVNNNSNQIKNNNNDNNDKRNDNRIPSNNLTADSIFELFKVQPRDNEYNKELDEFCEHLKSLYMTCFTNKSSSSCVYNSGLIYSPRIDIDLQRQTRDLTQSDKLYLYGITTPSESFTSIDSNQIIDESNVDDENLIIVDVRFHSLVYMKITGKIPDQTNLVSCVKLMDPNYLWFSMKFPVDFDKTVDMIISHVVYNVAEKEDTKFNINDFMLKLNGVNEFLKSDVPLSSYVYIQNCKKNNKHIVLELVDQTSPDFFRPFLRCESDTKKILNVLNYKKILHPEYIKNFHGYTAQTMNSLIEDLNISYMEFISAFNDLYYLTKNQKLFDSIVEKIIRICHFLSNVQTSELDAAMETLRVCYQNVETFANNVNPQNLNIDQLKRQFENAFLIVIQLLLDLIRMFVKMFPVDFKLPKAHNKVQKAISFDDDEQNENKFVTLKRRRKVEISQITNKFTLHIDICTQVKFLSNQFVSFFIVVNLCHGFNILRSKCTEKSRLNTSVHKTKLLAFNQILDFDISIYELPRETRVEFILIGVHSNSSNRLEGVDALATTFFYLYDIDEIFLNGSHLLPWKEMESYYSFPTDILEFDTEARFAIMRDLLENNYLVSYNLDPEAMMIVIHVAPNLPNNVDYYFPEIKNREVSLEFVIPPNNANYNSIAGDSLYGFHGYNPNKLSTNVIKILQKNPIDQLTSDERDLIWKERHTLKEFPGSILKIMKSPPNWSYHNLSTIYTLMKEFDSAQCKRVFHTKIEALQLLSMDYPDKIIRRTVVKWLNTVSVDELCDYLPQLVQALRFETSIDSHLIWSLFEFSLVSARFCHYFYWQLKSCLSDPTFGSRCQIYINSLLLLAGERTREQFEQQNKICEQFSEISTKIKQTAKDSRSSILRSHLEKFNEYLKYNPTSLPLSPSLFVNGLEVTQCSYFNSNSLPLKLVFCGAPPYKIQTENNSSHVSSLVNSSTNAKLQSIYKSKPWLHKIIFKCGDDLRKDMLVMQVISIINRVWLRAGLNLRLIIFGVLNSSDRTGMIEMVTRANTLREIQQEHGLTGNFKHHTIATWLKRHNTNEFDYKVAIENFIHSCAGYVVITYLLGICDRHNDNIMVTTSGNLFHIDFGKFFGDAQMMAGIKRDRVPFVFTADMAFVINEGGRPSKNYQFFVDLCCRCFILVRQNGDFLLSLLAMMIRSGIDYLSPETIQYFHKALMPNLIESQAKVEFNRLIEKAVGSFSTQLNFFIHSIAQTFSSGSNAGSSQDDRQSNFNNYLGSFPKIESSVNESTSNLPNIAEYDDDMPRLESESDSCNFTFTKCRVTEAMDGHITHLEIVNFRFFVPEKNGKVYFYKVKVDRRNYPENFVYRSFKEFIELHEKLSKTFPLVKFYSLKRSPMLNRSSRQEIASHRTRELQIFLKNLLQMASEISHSDIIYTFFHPILRDQQFTDVESSQSNSTLSIMSNTSSALGTNMPMTQPVFRRQPKIKLNIAYREDALHVLVCHVRNLDNDRVTAPDSYVKLYLRPDHNKSTKRKTRILQKNAHPTFMESFAYPYRLEHIITKTLEVSVWESDMTGNKRLGQLEIQLSQMDLHGKNERWYDLK